MAMAFFRAQVKEIKRLNFQTGVKAKEDSSSLLKRAQLARSKFHKFKSRLVKYRYDLHPIALNISSAG
jgi:hypothetical protein